MFVLYMCMFVLFVLCLTVLVNCFLNAFAICVDDLIFVFHSMSYVFWK